jgi:phosphoglycerol transferase MdoB-like AlkP superfamily enzyme
MLTASVLNRYIAPFTHTFLGEINAFLGNFSILFLIMTVAFMFIKKAKSRMIFLIALTFFLNLFIFAMGVFNMFFGTAFSIPASTIFKNPADGFAMGTFLNALLELITYWRIVVFIPFIILWVMYKLSDKEALSGMFLKVTVQKTLSSVLLVSMTFFTAIMSYYQQFQITLPINAVKSTFAIQNLGVYPYYVGEFFGKPFDLDLQRFLDLETEDKIAEAYQFYNKNKEIYTNAFDNKTYSNRLLLTDAVSNLMIDPSIQQDNNLHGILKDRNLVLIHLESMNTFLLEHATISQRFVFLKRLFEQSFVFNNFYNNVGMGVSSDGELAVMTGLYPMGDRTLYWEYNDIPYELESLPMFFNQLGYYTEAIHGDKETFYNRDKVYPELYGFDHFHSIEDFIQEGYDVQAGYVYDTVNNKVHTSPWISDYHLADFTHQVGSNLIQSSTPFMLFPVTMMPHTPYDFDPNGLRPGLFPEYENLISRITLKYISYVDYIDDVIKRFFISETGEDHTLENSVYVFYSDHGSGLKNGDLDILLNDTLSVIETRKILQKVPAWIYVPGDEMVDYGDYRIRKGLLIGEQNLVRSQVDLFRTIVELFDLPINDSPYYGVHGLSKEPTFALDNRLMDVVMDDYIYSMKNPLTLYPLHEAVSELTFEYIKRFKMLSDIIVSRADMQGIIRDAIRGRYGS